MIGRVARQENYETRTAGAEKGRKNKKTMKERRRWLWQRSAG